MKKTTRPTTVFVRLAVDADFALLPDGSDVSGEGRIRIMRDEVLELHRNEYVRGMISRGEFEVVAEIEAQAVIKVQNEKREKEREEKERKDRGEKEPHPEPPVDRGPPPNVPPPTPVPGSEPVFTGEVDPKTIETTTKKKGR